MSTPAGEILFLAHRIPFPPDRGDKIRSFNIIRRLAELASVHVAAFADDAGDAAHEAGLCQALGQGLAGIRIERRKRSKLTSLAASLATCRSASTAAFSSTGMRRHIGAVLSSGRVSSIFAFSGQMGQYVPENRGKTRFVMDFVDVDSAKFESYSSGAPAPLASLYRREARKLAREEQRIAANADVSLFVTEAEATLFRARSGLDVARVRALGNGVDLAFFDPAASFAPLDRLPGTPLLVFSGQMDYAPNVAAVTQFARETLPRIREGAAGATFAIVGRNPAPAVQALAGEEGVAVIGAVPDMRPWLAAADVVVAPLQIARGVQNKVLEAMAMGRPVVASDGAFEGIDAVPGNDLLVAEGSTATAASVLSLLRDPELAQMVGRAARARMCASYAWDRQLAGLPGLVWG